MRILFSGVFDLLHVGHVRAIKNAKKFGTLIVHVASDAEVRKVKGNCRPIIPGKERAEIIKSIKYVDEVYYKEKYQSEMEVAKNVKADAIIRNKGDNIKYPIKTIYVPRFIPKSKLDTSKIIKKIKKC